MDTRLLIAIALSVLTLFAYQEFVLKRMYPPDQTVRPSPSPRATPRISGADGGAVVAQPAAPQGIASSVPAPKATANDRTIKVETALYRAVFTSRGGRLKSMQLKDFREAVGRDSPLLEMVQPADGGELPLGLVLKRADTFSDDHETAYQTSAPERIDATAGDTATLEFRALTPDGISIVKNFRFPPSGYVFDMRAELSGQLGGVTIAGVEMSQSLAARPGYRDLPELQADINHKAFVDSESALRKGVQPVSGQITYAGFGDRYFLTVFLPQNPFDGTLAMDFDGTQATTRLLFPVHDGPMSLASSLYFGPKQLDILEAVNPELSKSIDFGWTGILALALLRALKLFHHISPNYGVDIILLTVAIRLLLLPMSIKSQRSMMRLQQLQPQVERIRDKFKEDRERLNKEMVDLYRRNHVNPVGGCMPMVIQLPIFIGLYAALLNAVELRHAPFMGWIRDLSAPDCLPIPGLPVLPYINCAGIPVLVLLMGLSTFVQQWMSPQPADPSQQRMMMFTPIIFTVMLVNFPAGLSLYYFASNVLGIAQQYILNREFRQPSPITA